MEGTEEKERTMKRYVLLGSSSCDQVQGRIEGR